VVIDECERKTFHVLLACARNGWMNNNNNNVNVFTRNGERGARVCLTSEEVGGRVYGPG
jgi:hypothetical protein